MYNEIMDMRDSTKYRFMSTGCMLEGIYSPLKHNSYILYLLNLSYFRYTKKNLDKMDLRTFCAVVLLCFCTHLEIVWAKKGKLLPLTCTDQ